MDATQARGVLEALAPHLPARRLRAGEILFQEKEPGDAMAFVLSGRLGLEVAVPGSSPESLGELRAGDLVGEMTCLDPAPRSATVRALEGSEVRVLDRGTLGVLRERDPATWLAVLRTVIGQVVDRVRETDRRLENLSRELRLAAGPDVDLAGAPSRAPGRDARQPQALSGFSRADLALFREAARHRRIADGDYVCREGEDGKSCFVVVTGSVDVIRSAGGEDIVLATLGADSIVGHNALVDHGPRSASVRARGDTDLLELDRTTFERLLDARVPLALRFQEQLAVTGIRQLRLADRWFARLGRIETPHTPVRPPATAPARTAVADPDHAPGPAALELDMSARPAPPAPPAPPPKAAAPDRPRPLPDARARGPEPRTEAEASRHVLSYVSTALREWGMSMSDLDQVRVVVPDGTVTASETRARKRWFG